MHICIYIYIYIHICICGVHLRSAVSRSPFVWLRRAWKLSNCSSGICTYVYDVYVYIYTYVHIYIYICICIYVYMYCKSIPGSECT